jgi:hypothetical protein
MLRPMCGSFQSVSCPRNGRAKERGALGNRPHADGDSSVFQSVDRSGGGMPEVRFTTRQILGTTLRRWCVVDYRGLLFAVVLWPGVAACQGLEPISQIEGCIAPAVESVRQSGRRVTATCEFVKPPGWSVQCTPAGIQIASIMTVDSKSVVVTIGTMNETGRVVRLFEMRQGK